MKDCPFCGSDDVDPRESMRETFHWVLCERCGARTGEFHSEEEAIEAWNRRAEEGE